MAKFNFKDLDDQVRALMVEEIQSDIAEDKLYLSSRLNAFGVSNYPDYLLQAAREGDEETLEVLLDINTCFNPSDYSKGKPSKMPKNSSKLICQSEFNRFYIRAICRKSILDNKEFVIVYRARESSWSRPESEAKIGVRLSAKELLDDLINSIGDKPTILPEVNSGLSVMLIENE